MKLSNSVKQLNLLFILTLPVFGFISFLKTGNVQKYYWSLLFFLVSYGLLFVLPENGDAYRHYQNFLISNYSFSEVVSEIKDVLFFQSRTNTDIYVLLSNYIISKISTTSVVYFGFHALIYALIYLASLKLILRDVNVHKNILTTIFFLLTIFIASIAKIQYLRYYLAAWFFLFATIGYLKTANKKYFIYGLVTPLIHFSFIVPLVLFIVYFFSKKRILIWFTIGVISFSANNILSQYSSVLLNQSSVYFKDSEVDQKSKAYVGNEEYIESRTNRFEARVWYANPAKYLNIAYTILLFLFGLLYVYNKVKINDYLLILLTFSFFLFSLSEMGQTFASFGERIQQLFLIVFSVFLLHYFSQNSHRFLRRTSYFLMPFFLIFLAMSLRELFVTGDLFTFIGNPYIALFIERTSFLSYLLP